MKTENQQTIQSLSLIHQGKVRDIYDIDDKTMLIVTTDRLSAFDVILPTPIDGKGIVLTEVANFWFDKLSHIIPNQLSDNKLEDLDVTPQELSYLQGRAIIVKKLKPLPVEAIVSANRLYAKAQIEKYTAFASKSEQGSVSPPKSSFSSLMRFSQS